MDSQVLTPFSSSTFHKTQFSALGQTFVKQKSGKFPWGALFKIIQKLRIKVLERNVFFLKFSKKPTEVPGSATHYKIFEIRITFLLVLYLTIPLIFIWFVHITTVSSDTEIIFRTFIIVTATDRWLIIAINLWNEYQLKKQNSVQGNMFLS